MHVNAQSLESVCVHVQTGQTIQREPRKRGERGNTLPRKPAAGWPILVTPLHAGGRRGTSFVASPDGSRRELTEDESLYLKHFKREVRPILLPLAWKPTHNMRCAAHVLSRRPCGCCRMHVGLHVCCGQHAPAVTVTSHTRFGPCLRLPTGHRSLRFFVPLIAKGVRNSERHHDAEHSFHAAGTNACGPGADTAQMLFSGDAVASQQRRSRVMCAVQPKIYSRPRSHAPYTNDTLHMFTQNKPNPRHDLYNPPYRGSPKPRHEDPRPDNRTSRKKRMAANSRRRELDKRLALMRM